MACGSSINILNYNWNEQISLQLGYGFSNLHCLSYSMIGYQEAYLYTKYPSIYWSNAVLQAEAGMIENKSSNSNKKESMTNYGKIASAIDKLQKNNVEIKLPNINISELGFLPDEKYKMLYTMVLRELNKINNRNRQI